MSPPQKKSRDSLGKFLPAILSDESETQEVKRYNIWRICRFLGATLLMLLVGLPWTVLFIEPAKTYGTTAVEFMGNVTTGVRDNLCNCRCALPLRTSGL